MLGKRQLASKHDTVILLPLRDPEIQKAKTIDELLLMPGNETRKTMFDEIGNNFEERICFILEGYDELPEDMHSYSVFTRLQEQLPKCT